MLDKKAVFISYDGSLYHGFQHQPDAKTVQGEILDCLPKARPPSQWRLSYSGRTDAGVSAIWQTVSFVAEEDEASEIIECISSKEGLFTWGVRYRLTPEFHASRSAIFRDYVYIDELENYKCKSVSFLNELSKELSSLRDFSPLYKDWKEPPHGVDRVRLYFIRVVPIGNKVALHVRGEGFVWNMVRRLADFLRKAECGSRLRRSFESWVPGASEPFRLFLVGVKYPFVPRVTAGFEEIFEKTFSRTKIESSVLSALKGFLYCDPLVYSPLSLSLPF